jgi:hypothetical protein
MLQCIGAGFVPVPSAQAPDGDGASTAIATDRPAMVTSTLLQLDGGGNAFCVCADSNGSHTVVGEPTLLVDRQLSRNWDAFTEYAGDFSHTGGPRHLLHVGTAYKVGARQQLDVHVGVGLSAAAVDHFIGIGYSFRLPVGRRVDEATL